MTYKDILQSDYFFNTYSQVEVLKRDFPVNHGFMHVWHVIKNGRMLAEMFELSEEEKRLLLIACTLHDIGYIKGRKDHDISGAELAKEYLNGKMEKNEIETICNAIANHGGDEPENFQDKVSKCLILADKLDFDNTRYRPDPNFSSVDMYLSIERVEFVKSETGFNFNIFTTNIDYFKEYKEQHFFKKLIRVFENFEKVTKQKINLVFNQA